MDKPNPLHLFLHTPFLRSPESQSPILQTLKLSSTSHRLISLAITQAVSSAPPAAPSEPVSTTPHRAVAGAGGQPGDGVEIGLGAARLVCLGGLAGRVAGVEVDGFGVGVVGVAVGGARVLGGVGPVGGRRSMLARRRLSGPGRGG